MYKQTLCVFVLLVLASTAYSQEEVSSKVVSLNAANYEASIATGYWLIEFYAPWCGHCKNLAPVWDRISVLLEDQPVNIAKVDCTVSVKICESVGAKSYPTIKLFSDKKLVETFNEFRDARNFINFLLKHVPGTSNIELEEEKVAKELETEDFDSKVVKLDDSNFLSTIHGSEIPAFVLFSATWCGYCKEMAPAWEILAKNMEGRALIAQIESTRNPDASAAYSITDIPTIKLFCDGNVMTFKGTRTAESLQRFVERNCKAFFPERVLSDEIIYEKGQISLNLGNFENATKGRDVFVYFFANWCTYCKRIEPVIEELAEVTPFHIGRVDIDVELELRNKYQIKSTPNFRLFKANGEILTHHAGSFPGFANWLFKHAQKDATKDQHINPDSQVKALVVDENGNIHDSHDQDHYIHELNNNLQQEQQKQQ